MWSPLNPKIVTLQKKVYMKQSKAKLTLACFELRTAQPQLVVPIFMGWYTTKEHLKVNGLRVKDKHAWSNALLICEGLHIIWAISDLQWLVWSQTKRNFKSALFQAKQIKVTKWK